MDHRMGAFHEHLFTRAWRKMAVVPLYHSNAGAHLYRQRVYVHTIVEQCKRSVGVPKAVKRSVLASAGACE